MPTLILGICDRIENWRRFLWWSWCDVDDVTVYENSDGLVPNKSSMMDVSKGPFMTNTQIWFTDKNR